MYVRISIVRRKYITADAPSLAVPLICTWPLPEASSSSTLCRNEYVNANVRSAKQLAIMDGLEEAGCAVSPSAQENNSHQVAYVNSNSNSNATINKPAVLSSVSDGCTSTAAKATALDLERCACGLDERVQKRVQTVILWVVILIALGLLCLPIVFYHIRNNVSMVIINAPGLANRFQLAESENIICIIV